MAVGTLVASLILAASARGQDTRRVAVLHFTAVSCGPCGAAALALERLKAEAGDSLSVIGVHYYDQYAVPDAESLASHYQVAGTPTSWFDGVYDQYYVDTATYWGYRNAFDKRKVVEPGAALALDGWADTVERTGELTCVAANPTEDTLHVLLRVAVIERAVYRPWGGGDTVFDVMRGMLPGFNGPELWLLPGADTSLQFPFHILADWDPGQIEFMAWAEGGGAVSEYQNGVIMQSARIGISQLTGVATGPRPCRPPDAMSAKACPNPVRERGTLRFSAARPGNFKAAFYDAAGRRLSEMDLGRLGAGEHRVSFQARSVNGRPWPAGVLFCRIGSTGERCIVKITNIN